MDEDKNEIEDGFNLYVGRHQNLYTLAYDAGGQILGYIPCQWSISGSGATLQEDAGALAILHGTAEAILTVAAAFANQFSDSLDVVVTQ